MKDIILQFHLEDDLPQQPDKAMLFCLAEENYQQYKYTETVNKEWFGWNTEEYLIRAGVRAVHMLRDKVFEENKAKKEKNE